MAGMNLRCQDCMEVRYHEECQHVSLMNVAIKPGEPIIKLPRSKWRRAWLSLRGWELYGK